MNFVKLAVVITSVKLAVTVGQSSNNIWEAGSGSNKQ